MAPTLAPVQTTVTYPPALMHQCAVLKAAWALCVNSTDRALKLGILNRLHEIEDGY